MELAWRFWFIMSEFLEILGAGAISALDAWLILALAWEIWLSTPLFARLIANKHHRT
jgi:hypothetical protein